MKSFKQFNEENEKPVVITFGRFNPPTVGHGKLFKKVASIAKGNDYRIHSSQSSDPKKNPLRYKDKIKFLRKMFPEHGRSFILDTSIKNIFNAASKAHDDGYNKLIVVVGSDRVNEFKKTLTKYNGEKGRHGFYDFEHGIEIKSAGARDPDSDDAVEAMSASKMRAAAEENDLKTFTLGMPKNFRGVADLLNAVRKGMGLKESTNLENMLNLKPPTPASNSSPEKSLTLVTAFLRTGRNTKSQRGLQTTYQFAKTTKQSKRLSPTFPN